MVSFSCDHCQDVFTRAKIDRHFLRCRTQSVSCIDCGAVFNANSVKGHTSCITEAEKYEGRGKLGERRPNTKSYCGVCDQAIPGLVAAEQHYASKKHRAQQRRLNEQNKAKETVKKEAAQMTADTAVAPVPAANKKKGNAKAKNPSLKRIMKRVLKAAPKNRLREQALVDAVKAALDGNSVEGVSVRVPQIAEKSRRFAVGKYIEYVPK